MISILILTKNEERDLPGCLESVLWSDDIHVFDSGSTDGTLQCAQSMGAKTTVRTYENGVAFGGDESAHRNWALENLPFKYPWIFCIDADERMTPSLVAGVQAAVRSPCGSVAFRVQRRDFLFGTWLRYVQATAYYVRLFQPSRLRYERLINPVSIADGPIGEVTGCYLDHYPFSKGIDHWVAKHNAYSRLEAEQIVSNRSSGLRFSWLSAFAARDFNQRRFHQKEMFYRMPFRPALKFFLLYALKRGFLDGRAGLTYAMLQAIYEYFIVLKVREIEGQKSGSEK